MAASDYSNFLVRLTPKTRALLDAASKDKEMPRAHIINNALKSYLKEYNNADINSRLNALKAWYW
jgi:hypothetical protein